MSTEPTFEIRTADRDADGDAVWALLEPTFRAGDTYAFDPDISRDDAIGWWFASSHEVWVAELDGKIIGTYYLRANHGGNASHVANAGYVVSPDARGAGIGRRLCSHSVDRARERGFTAMQYNLVVSTNEPAVRLWRSLGFEIVGRIPDGFDHPRDGLVEAYIMHRHL